MQLVFVGHSHITALERAYRADEHVRQLLEPWNIAFVNVREAIRGHLVEPGPAGDLQVNPELMEILSDHLGRSGLTAFVSVLGGPVLAHHALVIHPEPYDFDIGDPELALDADVRVLHRDILADVIRAHSDDNFRFFDLFAKMTTNAIFHLDVPPPIGDQSYIAQHLGIHFPTLPAARISTPRFRYKWWRLHGNVFMQKCESLGIQFVEVPPAARTPEGYLSEQAWGNDCIHANAWYGSQMLKMLKIALFNHYQVGSERQ